MYYISYASRSNSFARFLTCMHRSFLLSFFFLFFFASSFFSVLRIQQLSLPYPTTLSPISFFSSCVLSTFLYSKFALLSFSSAILCVLQTHCTPLQFFICFPQFISTFSKLTISRSNVFPFSFFDHFFFNFPHSLFTCNNTFAHYLIRSIHPFIRYTYCIARTYAHTFSVVCSTQLFFDRLLI